jgi:DNA uptake protein ComE-like DNA-binding protein
MPKFSLQNYFGFNKKQRNGLFVLMLVSFSLLVIRLVYPYFIKRDDIVILNLPMEERRLDSAIAHAPKKPYTNSYSKETTTSKLFNFDPNTVSLEQLIALGFKEKNAAIFVKFRNRGFIFKKKEDLKKVYGISDYLYTKLEPYIVIGGLAKNVPESINENAPLEIPAKAKTVTVTKVELNGADSLTLVGLPGIGPVFAKRIIKYRNILGGYISIDQLKEVYGFTEEVFNKTHSNFTVDASGIKKINLNTDDFKTINRHPYLGYEMAKLICNQRRAKPITAADLEGMMIKPELYQKLLPYLVFD